jgi:ABC-type amino acid transport substrate-binding protein
MHRLYILLILLAFSCTKANIASQVRVGIDPNFPQIQSAELRSNVIGFLKDLLNEITTKHKINFHFVDESSKELEKGLLEDRSDIIFTNITPYNFNEKIYDFSKIIIPLGPYPVIRKNDKIGSLKDFKNKLVGVQEDDLGFLDLKNYSNWNLKIYSSELNALNDLVNGEIDIVLIRYLSALSYVEDTFYNQLELLNIPLNNQGYRFISLKDQHLKIINLLNEKIGNFQKNDALIKKWNLKLKAL